MVAHRAKSKKTGLGDRDGGTALGLKQHSSDQIFIPFTGRKKLFCEEKNVFGGFGGG